nr:hypothetical protein [Tanacetum cinerariifolium]
IPYFELIRVFFYNASQRLTRFFFSQSSLESLCRPFDAPTIENSFLARFCVASADLSMLEAQVIFHPITDKKHNFPQLNHLPLCSNILQTKSPKARLIELWNKDLTTHSIVKHPLHTTRSKRDERGITGVNALRPRVECGLPWAQLPAGKNNFHELTDPTVSTFLSTEGRLGAVSVVVKPVSRILTGNPVDDFVQSFLQNLQGAGLASAHYQF